MILAFAGLVSVIFAPLPLPEALARLSAAMGERLECAPALRNEVLVLRLKDADEARTLREIAGLYDAAWEKRNERLVLVPDPAAIRRHAARTAEASAKTYRGSVAYLVRRLAGQPPTFGAADAAAYAKKKTAEDAARKRAEEANDPANMFTASSAAEETPAWRAVARIVPLLGEAEMLTLPNDSRTVWSERPTRMQRAFPSAAENALRQYRDELEAFKPAVSASRVRIVAKRWEQGGAFNISLEAVDNAGKVVDSAFARINDDSDRMRTRSTVFDAPKPVPGERPLVVPAEAQEYGKVMNQLESSSERTALMPKWRPILADPLAYEPTRWLPAGALLAAAEALGENLVGAPGELTGGKYDRAIPNETPTQFVRRASGVVERDGWLVLRDPEDIPRLPRDGAKGLILGSVRRGGVELDAAAAWAGASDVPFPFTDWVGDHLDALVLNAGATTGDRYGLRLWSAFGEPVRRALRDGKTVDLNDLPPAGQDWTTRIAYWHGGIEGGEPTEILPNGIDGGTVSMTVKETMLVVASTSSSPGVDPSRPLTAERLGKSLAKGDAYREIKPETFQAYDRYRMGVSRAYTLHFLLGHERVPMEYELDESFFDPSRPPLDALPKEFADRVAAARTKAAATPDPPKGDTP